VATLATLASKEERALVNTSSARISASRRRATNAASNACWADETKEVNGGGGM
jgi:hypothetical protein